MIIVSVPFCYRCGVPHVPEEIAERVRSGESITIDIVYHASGVAANVLQHGTGALNIAACRISHNEPIRPMKAQPGGNLVYGQAGRYEDTTELKPEGRWPSNVVLGCCGNDPHDPDCAAAMLDAQTAGTRASKPGATGKAYPSGLHGIYGHREADYEPARHDDSGGASRFFYVAKASRRERNAGLEGMPERVALRSDLEPSTREWVLSQLVEHGVAL